MKLAAFGWWCLRNCSQKGNCCRGTKNAKQQMTAVFFVNAVGNKEAIIVTGNCRLLYCFPHLANPSYPCGAQYFSNEEWMRSKIMVTVLTSLNNHLTRSPTLKWPFYRRTPPCACSPWMYNQGVKDILQKEVVAAYLSSWQRVFSQRDSLVCEPPNGCAMDGKCTGQKRCNVFQACWYVPLNHGFGFGWRWQ